MVDNIDDDDLLDDLTTFGHTVDDTEALDKLKLLCVTHHISPSDIVLEWVAFCQSSKKSPKLNQESLDQFERERLNKASNKHSKPITKSQDVIRGASALEDIVDADTADELLGAYATPNSKASKKRLHTPEGPQNKRLTGLSRSPATAPFSPASFSPAIATPSQKYSGRKNAGEVVFSFGPSARAKWRSDRDVPCAIDVYPGETALTERFKFMFQKLTDKANVLNDQLEDMAEQLKEHYKVEDFSHVALPSQDLVTVCGRIACDSNGKLNAQSVLLEGSRDTSAGKQIPVDLSQVKQYSLFPGQLVAMDGINSAGGRFVAKKIYESVPQELPATTNMLPEGPLKVVVAAGPFSTSDSFMYEPLTDLVNSLQKNPPDVCIMLGPFLDVKNPDLEKGLGAVTFEDFFQKTVESLLSGTQGSSTQFVLVPSWRDAHHDFVFPQAPYNLGKQTPNAKRLHMVSDPCTLNIDGVVFGITSTDVLFHLGAEEISSSAGSSDRLARLTQHILTQRNYYPLYPPSEEVNIDYDRYERHARLPVTPHLLVVPSELRYFVKDIGGCCCVNPGRLAKGQVGGTFSRIIIEPTKEGKAGSLISQVAAEIVRI